MSPSPTHLRHRVSAQIVWVSITFGVFLLLALLGSASWAVSQIDARAITEERNSLAAALQQAKDRMPIEQDSSTAWDHTVIIAQDGQFIWMAENLAEQMSSLYGHDRVYVVSPNGSVLQAASAGVNAGTSLASIDAGVLAPLIERLRDELAQSDPAKAAPAARANGGLLETALLENGEVGFVSIRPIVPADDAIARTPDSMFLLASIKLIDQALLDDIGERFDIQNLRRVPRSTAAAVLPITDWRGQVVADLVWTPKRPAMILFAETAPAIFGMIALGALCMIALLAWLRRTSLQLERSQAEARYLSLHDPLTGAANRMLFETRLREAQDYPYVAKTRVLLASLDLDHFKDINDTLGHAIGDELLRKVVKRLLVELPEEGTLARLGGDEFAIVQPGIVSAGQAQWICQRLLRCLSEPFPLSSGTITVTASIGVSLEHGTDIASAEMLRRADVALYAAKLEGRNTFALYDPEMDRKNRDKRMLEVELRDALLNDTGLHLLYQPIFAARTGALVGAEALVRWQHPTRGALSPDIFIGVAEETGVIEQLGLWVLSNACRFALKADLPSIAVNFSPVQFRNRQLAQQILAILREERLPPDRLEVEITEGLLLQNSPLVQSTLAKLREAGVRIALDDFGTGYSSISYLRTYTVDKLKIDQSFSQLVEDDPAIARIVRSIIEMADALGMSVTAEGVEKESQRRMLTGMGCTQLQGYLLSRPLPPERLTALIEEQRSSDLVRLFSPSLSA
jgi:diguanylate cyclase (GGDEF)-like protein